MGARTAVVILVVLSLASAGVVSAESPAPGVHVGATPTELQIARFYRAVLDREPDQNGLTYWYRLLSTGADLTAIADGFAASEEFERRFGVAPGPDGNQRFVMQVYENVLDRLPDADGEAYWLGLLDEGVPRAQMVLWFSESAEFINRTGLSLAEIPAFVGTMETVTAEDLGVSWRSGCPVGPDGLRLLSLSFVDFEGHAQVGELVVHADDADVLLQVFQRLYESRYPIQSMRTIDEFDGSDDASMDANNTSAFNCRTAVGGSSWSLHAYGKAIDINPLVNPYVKGPLVLPPIGEPFVDREGVHNPGLIRDGDIVVRSFDEIGWFWGGRWDSPSDYQHFSSNNR
jgi:hypothetical protein